MWWHMFCTLFYLGKSYTVCNDICNDISWWHIAMMYHDDISQWHMRWHMFWWHITMTYTWSVFWYVIVFRPHGVESPHMSSDMSLRGGVITTVIRYVIIYVIACPHMSLHVIVGFRTSVMTYHDDISWWHIKSGTCPDFDMSSWYVIVPICHRDMSSWHFLYRCRSFPRNFRKM